MAGPTTRRRFLQAAGCAALAPLAVRADPPATELGTAADHTLTIISGKPVERGRRYGRLRRDAIQAFLEREIYASFSGKPSTRDEMLRYADHCWKPLQAFAPLVAAEMGGLAEGAGLRVEEVVLLSLHEELWHRGVIQSMPHCTAVAAGPPATRDGSTYVGQTWDWMKSVYGLSSMLLWKRPEGPDLLAYSYPGLWVGAGMNSAGIALCWTSGSGLGIKGPRVGIPSYALIAQMLYQNTLNDAVEEARRAGHAGWFTFVLADGEGRIANVEGAPGKLAVEHTRGHMARVDYGTRELTGSPAGQPVKLHPRCGRVCDMLAAGAGKLDRATIQGYFGDHGDPAVCIHSSTLDAMLFDTTRREAHVARGPGCSGRWKTFTF